MEDSWSRGRLNSTLIKSVKKKMSRDEHAKRHGNFVLVVKTTDAASRFVILWSSSAMEQGQGTKKREENWKIRMWRDSKTSFMDRSDEKRGECPLYISFLEWVRIWTLVVIPPIGKGRIIILHKIFYDDKMPGTVFLRRPSTVVSETNVQ